MILECIAKSVSRWDYEKKSKNKKQKERAFPHHSSSSPPCW